MSMKYVLKKSNYSFFLLEQTGGKYGEKECHNSFLSAFLVHLS